MVSWIRAHFQQILLLSLFSTIGVVNVGCSSHSIRSGVWRLTFDAQDYKTQQPQEVPPRDVHVLVGWDENQKDQELVEIELLDSPEPQRFKRMYGNILGGGQIIRILAKDRYWVFRMQGEIKHDEYISGSGFLARHVKDENTSLTGRWEMKWVRDGS